MPNGIELILADHRYVDQLFSDFASSADATVIGQILDALTAHDDAEHSALYPLAGEVLGDAGMIEELDAAHSAIKKQMEFLRSLEGPPLTVAVNGLRKLVQQHVADEEKRLLPALSNKATPVDLQVLATRILATKQRVG